MVFLIFVFLQTPLRTRMIKAVAFGLRRRLSPGSKNTASSSTQL
jgi:hypothetical protein